MNTPKKPFWYRTPGEGSAQATDGQNKSGDQRIPIEARPAGESYMGSDRDGAYIPAENDDPTRRRAVQGGRVGIAVKLARALSAQYRYLTRRLTPEEAAEAAEKRKRRELKKVLLADAKVWNKWMINALCRLGMTHKVEKQGFFGKEIVTQKVIFDYVAMEPDSIAYHVDMQNLPYGVSTEILKSDEVANNLAMSAGRRITSRWKVETGLWFVVERASGRAGIRNHVQVSEMWDAMPPSANALTIPVGITHNARMVYTSIADMPHALIAGTTGSGKSNFEHVGINTLIRRNPPDRVRLVLIDLKGGLEFQRYVGVPHLLHITCEDIDKTGVPCDSNIAPDGIVTERERVPDLLVWLRAYGEKRMKTLLAAKASNIGEYNAHRRNNRMPFLVIWVDEWADVRLGKGGQAAEDELVNLVQRMRAVGMYFILATQIPKSEVITGLIKGNLPCRFAFSVPNIHASQTIIDTGDAAGLEPTGRCIMQHRGEIQIQTPYISRDMIQQTIEGATTGNFAPIAAHDVTPLEVMIFALSENNGWLSIPVLWRKFQERGIPRAELEGWLASWQGNEYIIDNSSYIVKPAEGNKGRRLVAVDVAEPQSEPVQAEQHKYHVGEELLSAKVGETVTITALLEYPKYRVSCKSYLEEFDQVENDLYPGAEQ